MHNKKLTSTPANEEDLLLFLDKLDIKCKTYRHEPMNTVAESKANRPQQLIRSGGHCKNLFLKDKKGNFWLFITLEEKKVNMNSLQKELGAARLSFGNQESMIKYLGVKPGSVTPFSAINSNSKQVKFVLDAKMLESKTLNYHPLHNTATTKIKSNDLLTFLQECGHKPIIISI